MYQQERAKSAAPPPHEASYDDGPDLPIEYCPNCSAKLFGRSCKMQCPRCGYFLSCSDYY